MTDKKSISKEEVPRTAYLARLDLSSSEINKFSEQLASVLANFSQIDKIETKDIPITAQVTGLEDVLVEDNEKMKIKVSREDILANAPEQEEGFLVVPRVLWKTWP